ncbi:hypothetical protein [Speluncibacter jeojiensis]|uniref:YbjN domain-containing protein n=1 Tax=Speluncibacter jeojiensis TaxID=2710754 RepID=A0A9X4LY27_9ACTN|nr:hypothetical protein [Rhodococcus sp. D2-41]MDG3013307.1 hypothetical protein [Corynebacteriales bacterium D3-21]
MTDSEVGALAELRERVRVQLGPLVDMRSPAAPTNGDDALSFDYAGAPCAVRAFALADGLDVLSMTCVLAWDIPLGPDLRATVARAAESVQFGSVNVIERPDSADVLLQYTFPAGTLEPEALRTMLLLVLSGVGEMRESLRALNG